MTLRIYADRKNISLDRVSVDVAHEKVQAVDCAGARWTPRRKRRSTASRAPSP
nr:hypothetical protein [Bradyrhizobium sp. Rc2d]